MNKIGYLCLCLCILTVHAQDTKVHEVTQKYVLTKLTDTHTVIIDVRTAQEYQRGHIPSALNIPHAELLKNSTVLDKFNNKNIVLYCHSGRRVKKVTNRLHKTQYKLFHLKGDYRSWRAHMQPISTH